MPHRRCGVPHRGAVRVPQAGLVLDRAGRRGPALGLVGRLAVLRRACPAAVHGVYLDLGVPLLAVIHRFTGGSWLIGVAYPLAAVGVAFLWAYFSCLRYLPAGPWLKAGVFALITAVASPVFNALCERLIPDIRQPWRLNYITFAALLAAAVILLAVGVLQERKQRNLSD